MAAKWMVAFRAVAVFVVVFMFGAPKCRAALAACTYKGGGQRGKATPGGLRSHSAGGDQLLPLLGRRVDSQTVRRGTDCAEPNESTVVRSDRVETVTGKIIRRGTSRPRSRNPRSALHGARGGREIGSRLHLRRCMSYGAQRRAPYVVTGLR